MTQQQIADNIPHEYRRKILLDWLPGAQPNMGNMNFKLLWEAYFIYVDPSGVKKVNCPICWGNVLDQWKILKKNLIIAEKAYNTFDAL